jgi:hypothetical protein
MASIREVCGGQRTPSSVSPEVGTLSTRSEFLHSFWQEDGTTLSRSRGEQARHACYLDWVESRRSSQRDAVEASRVGQKSMDPSQMHRQTSGEKDDSLSSVDARGGMGRRRSVSRDLPERRNRAGI